MFEAYLLAKEKSSTEHRERMRLHEEAQANEQRCVEAVIAGKLGIYNFWTNGYSYRLCYKGYQLQLCNQDTRTVGEYYLEPCTNEEIAFFKDNQHHMLYSETRFGNEDALKILHQFHYSSICFEGGSVSGSILRIFKEIDAKRQEQGLS